MAGRVVISWPEIQYLYGQRGFEEHSKLITDGPDYEWYGDCSYYVDEQWVLGLCVELRQLIGFG